jgi:hypothetical protein
MYDGGRSGFAGIGNLHNEVLGGPRPIANIFRPSSARIRARVEYGPYGTIGLNSTFFLDGAPSYDANYTAVVVPSKQRDSAIPPSKFVSKKRTVTCQVEEVLPDCFTAIYWENDDGPRRITVSYEGLSQDDLTRVQPRADFYWTVGTEVREDGRTSTTSLIIFPRQPPVSRSQWRAALEDARENAKKLGYSLLQE